jgi:hypothetical protein
LKAMKEHALSRAAIQAYDCAWRHDYTVWY